MFRNERQRRAAFSRMASAPRTFGRRVKQRVNQADSRTLGATTAGALGASMAPWVTHVEGFGTREALRSPGKYLWALGKQFPHMGTYAAIPAAATLGALALQRRRDQKAGRKPMSTKDIAKRVGTAGAVGFGGWLGERAILHSLPAFMNQPFVGRPMTNRLRAELLLGHGLPLAIGAGAIGVLAHRAARKQGEARKVQAPEVIKKTAPIGAATLMGHWFGVDRLVHKSGILYNRPRLAAAYYKGVNPAVLMGSVPAYMAYRMLKRRRELQQQHTRRAA